jgi:3-dehydroshikimate dehydratase
MNINLCTISFRHHLVSFEEIVDFAAQKGFAGVELWGIHAHHFFESGEKIDAHNLLLEKYGLSVPMMTGYLNLFCPDNQIDCELEEARKLISLAHAVGTKRIRVFAGNMPSSAVLESSWEFYTQRIRLFAHRLFDNGIRLVVETHPNTLADTLGTTRRIIDEVNHPGLGINFDILHIWEGGDDPLKAYSELKPHIAYFHLKNITSRENLRVFSPQNVYSPSGDRKGIVHLRDGALDYAPILEKILFDSNGLPFSLEWFGDKPFTALAEEIEWIGKIKKTIEMKNEERIASGT